MSAEPRRSLSAAEVAALTGGRLVGPADTHVAAIAPLERAGPGDLSFLVSARYLPYFERSRASIVLCAEALATAAGGGATRVIVPDPHAALLTVLAVLYPTPAWTPGVHPTAVIGVGATWSDPVAIGPHVVLGSGVTLGRNVRIGAQSVLGDGVMVGDDCELYPQVTCYAGTTLGRRVILHAGVRIGSDGFGYVPGRDGAAHRRIPHVGRCVIGDDVEIGANSCIDRGSVDDTIIGDGTKLDNLVHIAHNVHVGKRCMILALAGIAGSCRIEDDVVIAGEVGISDHCTIGRGARVLVQAGVIGDVAPGTTVWGTPARPHREVLRATAALYRGLDRSGHGDAG
ncbi:MAG TPA: UDP-3-O-(3-hydroxymyristoyl)glucosamine N-acyltransferase [Gemmatimonadales bacterium]|nr:UDP-3-O-(3-hydroxymyristoyl)glucosamine N-acyltransferase [Gemmatimonadales bacterium]